jgi:hypothetical protein
MNIVKPNHYILFNSDDGKVIMYQGIPGLLCGYEFHKMDLNNLKSEDIEALKRYNGMHYQLNYQPSFIDSNYLGHYSNNLISSGSPQYNPQSKLTPYEKSKRMNCVRHPNVVYHHDCRFFSVSVLLTLSEDNERKVAEFETQLLLWLECHSILPGLKKKFQELINNSEGKENEISNLAIKIHKLETAGKSGCPRCPNVKYDETYETTELLNSQHRYTILKM